MWLPVLALASLASPSLASPSLASPSFASPPPTEPGADHPWVGCWRATDDSGEVLWLQEDRAGWIRDGQPSFHRLHEHEGELILERWSRLTRVRPELGDDGALLLTGDVERALEPCEVPVALRIEPYAWPTDASPDAAGVDAIAAELAARRDEDQRVRRFSGRPSEEEVAEMRRVDEDNVAYLAEQLALWGWIDAERFGAEASDAAFLIVQHCGDLRLMRTALPHIEADVAAGRVDGQSFALLHDRLQLNLGGLQRYGSQLSQSEEFGLVLMPCEDYAGVDALRAELGMMPLDAYLGLFAGGDEEAAPGYLPHALRAHLTGWTPLFNGRNLDGWHVKIRGHELDDNFADTFRVEDGVIRVGYEGYERFDGRFGHLIHDTAYSRYRLRVEYRFVGEQCPGGPGWAWRNSGVMLHGQAPRSMTVDQEFPVSAEVQLLGGDGENERPTANLCTPGTHVVMDGELVKRHCIDSASKTVHGDAWVVVEVEVLGNESIRHYVDGELVMVYEHPQLDENDGDARRLIEAGAPIQLDAGYFSLQSESHGVEFRAVEIRTLEDER